MKTFHDFLKTKCERLWLNEKNAVPGHSNVNPLNQPKPPTPSVTKLRPVTQARGAS